MENQNQIQQVQQSIYTLQSQLDTIVYGLGAAQSTLESMRNNVNNWSQTQSLAPAQQQQKIAPATGGGSTQRRATTKKRVVSEATKQKLREAAARQHGKTATKASRGKQQKVMSATA